MSSSDEESYARNRSRVAELEERRKRIRELNDRLRIDHVGGLIVLTPGVRALSSRDQSNAIVAVRAFHVFTEDNDPNDEHDFGTLPVAGEQMMWKIDYYDKRVECGSPDPSNPDLTTRVLTIMLASEY